MSKVINPYIFVNLPNERSQLKEEKGSLTGKIECSIFPRTHLFIPNTTNKNVFLSKKDGHKSYDFFSYEDLADKKEHVCNKPIIPGSSIRGEIRSLYEALTNSCLSSINNEQILYKRLPNSGEMGILKNVDGIIFLYKATKYMARYGKCEKDDGDKIFNGEGGIKQFKKEEFYEGQKVFFKHSGKYPKGHYMPYMVNEISTTQPVQEGYKEGYVLLGEPFGYRKHHFTIAEIGECYREVKPEEIEMLYQVIQLYSNEKINNHKKIKTDIKIDKIHHGYEEYKQNLDKMLKNDQTLNQDKKMPVFYKDFNNCLYLSPSCISKEVYKNKINDLLQKGNFNPCKKEENICPTCNLFGMVSESRNGSETVAISSRLRFSDAELNYNGKISELFEPFVTLKELSSPKTSTTEFYLQAPNFDYKDLDIPKKPKKINNGQEILDLPKGKKTMQELRILIGNEKTEDEELIQSAKKTKVSSSNMWHYDFSFNWDKVNGKCIPKDINNSLPRIKGRKFYWHHKNYDLNNDMVIEKNEKNITERNITVRLLKPCRNNEKNNNPDYSFKFTIYFEKLSKSELDKLIGTIELGGDGYHSLGHGKPLGLGSSKISVDNILLRKLEILDGCILRSVSDKYKKQTNKLTEIFKENEVCAKQIEIISSLHDFKCNVKYPTSEGSDYVYKWFSNNRVGMNDPKIIDKLPNIPTENLDCKNLEEKVALNQNKSKK